MLVNVVFGEDVYSWLRENTVWFGYKIYYVAVHSDQYTCSAYTKWGGASMSNSSSGL